MSPELVAALDALPAAVEAACSERLRKIEAALEWTAGRHDIRIESRQVAVWKGNQFDSWPSIIENHNGTGPSIADALIALHERAGK